MSLLCNDCGALILSCRCNVRDIDVIRAVRERADPTSTPEPSPAALTAEYVAAIREDNARHLEDSRHGCRSCVLMVARLLDAHDALAVRLAEMDAALQSLTPGGSEFVGDAARCVAHVREVRALQHRALTEFKRRAEDAEARGDALAGRATYWHEQAQTWQAQSEQNAALLAVAEARAEGLAGALRELLTACQALPATDGRLIGLLPLIDRAERALLAPPQAPAGPADGGRG